MFAKELIGQLAIREKPVMKSRYVREGGFSLTSGERKVEERDYYYCQNPVWIVGATDHNIIVEEKGFITGDPIRKYLDERYCDDNWISVDSIVDAAAPNTDQTINGENADN